MDDPKIAAMNEAKSFLAILNEEIIFPLIFLMTGIAFIFFLYGMAVYVMNAGSEPAREVGRKNITYGIIGLVIMASAYSILNIAAGTFGFTKQLDCAQDPSGNGCSEAFEIE